MKRLSILKYEKDNGLVWVEYPLCIATPTANIPEFYRVDAIVELKIQQGEN